MYIVLSVMCLTYTRSLIRFSNCAGLSQLGASGEINSLHAGKRISHEPFVPNYFQIRPVAVTRF